MPDFETELIHLKDTDPEDGKSVLEGIIVPTKRVLEIINLERVGYLHRYIQNELERRKRIFNAIKVKNYAFTSSQCFYHLPSKNLFTLSDGISKHVENESNEFYYNYSKDELEMMFYGENELVFPSEYIEGDKFYIIDWLLKHRFNRKTLKGMILKGMGG